MFKCARIAGIARDELLRFRDKGLFWLFAFVVMPDHLHFLIRTRDKSKTLGRIVAMLKSSIQFRSRRAGVDFMWQDYFHDHILRPSERLEDFVGYIVLNPERAGIVHQGEAYRFVGVVDQYW